MTSEKPYDRIDLEVVIQQEITSKKPYDRIDLGEVIL